VVTRPEPEGVVEDCRGRRREPALLRERRVEMVKDVVKYIMLILRNFSWMSSGCPDLQGCRSILVCVYAEEVEEESRQDR